MAKDNTAPNLTLNPIEEKKKADAYDSLNTAPNLTLAPPVKIKPAAEKKAAGKADPAEKDSIG